MNVADLRDWVLIIFFILATVGLIFCSIFSWKLYLRAERTLASVDNVACRASDLLDYITQVAKPLVTIATIVEGIRQGMKAFGGLSEKKEEEKP